MVHVSGDRHSSVLPTPHTGWLARAFGIISDTGSVVLIDEWGLDPSVVDVQFVVGFLSSMSAEVSRIPQ